MSKKIVTAFAATHAMLVLCLWAISTPAYATDKTDNAGFGCDAAKMPKAKFYSCESTRLRYQGEELAAEASQQMAQGQNMQKDCVKFEDPAALRDCDLGASDIITDAAFKQMQSVEMMEESGRMAERAAAEQPYADR